jgi:hypothetical protein
LAISSCPAHAVTPVISSPALTTNSDAMKIVDVSPRPQGLLLRMR